MGRSLVHDGCLVLVGGDTVRRTIDRGTRSTRQTFAMAFGQQSGPPASRRAIEQLLDLLLAEGHVDFRDARGPMGFTQRQAAGKFTSDEAAAFIEQLEATQYASDDDDSPPPPPVERLTAADRAVRKLSDAALAAELQRRGWVVMEP